MRRPPLRRRLHRRCRRCHRRHRRRRHRRAAQTRFRRGVWSPKLPSGLRPSRIRRRRLMLSTARRTRWLPGCNLASCCAPWPIGSFPTVRPSLRVAPRPAQRFGRRSAWRRSASIWTHAALSASPSSTSSSQWSCARARTSVGWCATCIPSGESPNGSRGGAAPPWVLGLPTATSASSAKRSWQRPVRCPRGCVQSRPRSVPRPL